MNKQHGCIRYWSTFVQDRQEGFVGLQMHRETPEGIALAAEVIFWDATGQFFVETHHGDLPVTLIEDLIAEAKATIKIR